MPLERRLPWHELERQTVVDHGEASGRQRDTPPIDAGDVFAFGGWLMHQARLPSQSFRCFIQLALSQGIEQIAGEEDALTLAPRQPLFREVINASVHRVAHLAAECVAARYRLLR
jgi:hypothetical protein